MNVLLNTDTGEGFDIIRRATSVFDVSVTGSRQSTRTAELVEDIINLRDGNPDPAAIAQIAEVMILIKQLRTLRPELDETIADEVDRRLRVFDTHVRKKEAYNNKAYAGKNRRKKNGRRFNKKESVRSPGKSAKAAKVPRTP